MASDTRSLLASIDIVISEWHYASMPKVYREGVKVVKTMIYLEEDVHLRLKHLAVDERLSMAELIRRAVDEYLKQYPKGGEEK